ncbi:MAG TPA: serine hydrolase [Xanthobacteraceae bacterium]
MRLATAALLMAMAMTPAAGGDRAVETIISREVQTIVPADGAGGVAVALRVNGRTSFFNYGLAERGEKRPITTDTLFNLASLRKVFEATLLAQGAKAGDLGLDEPVAKYVTELQQGGDIRRVTLGQLATHTSGLLLPQDHPPWPDWGYTLAEFIATLNAWKPKRPPGQQHLYTHAGFILLQLALERRYGAPIDELIEQRVLRPLAMNSTALARGDDGPRGQLSPELKRRAVQGYGDNSEPIGEAGEQHSYYHWAGTGQMYSSARDMAFFLAANMGELPVERSLRDAFALAHHDVLQILAHSQQALAWEVLSGKGPAIVEKYGGLNNASAYIGFMPSRGLGIVILGNRGNQYPNEVGRLILRELAAR